MKRIILIFLAFTQILCSCVEHMEEAASSMIAGTWAVVDDDNLACKYYIFKEGEIFEYKSYDKYFVFDKTLWGVIPLEIPTGFLRYKYSFKDGILNYHNPYYNYDVQVEVKIDGDTMMFGNEKCRRINKTSESLCSTIVFPSTNRTIFSYAGEDVEWDYQITNPVPGYEFRVTEAPEWCGGIEGVTISDGKILFSVPASDQKSEGKFVFSYPSAATVEVEVKQGVAKINIDDDCEVFRYTAGTGSFGYTILNMREGFDLTVKTNANWIKDIQVTDNMISYKVEENESSSIKNGKITLSYAGVSVEHTVLQGSSRNYGYWIGKWAFKGANGQSENVTILPDKSYSTYLMTGYGGLSEDLPITIEWGGGERITISNQCIGKSYFSDGMKHDIWLIGVDSGTDFLNMTEGLHICHGDKADDGNAAIKPSKDQMTMCLLFEHDGIWKDINGDILQYPTFPFTVSPAVN